MRLTKRRKKIWIIIVAIATASLLATSFLPLLYSF